MCACSRDLLSVRECRETTTAKTVTPKKKTRRCSDLNIYEDEITRPLAPRLFFSVCLSCMETNNFMNLIVIVLFFMRGKLLHRCRLKNRSFTLQWQNKRNKSLQVKMWSVWGVRDGDNEMNEVFDGSSGSCQSTKGSWPAGGALTSLRLSVTTRFSVKLFQCWLHGPLRARILKKINEMNQSGSTLNPGNGIHSRNPSREVI